MVKSLFDFARGYITGKELCRRLVKINSLNIANLAQSVIIDSFQDKMKFRKGYEWVGGWMAAFGEATIDADIKSDRTI